ncbi:PREDICTED: uncharacterized protein LOC108634507 [Capra hircus]|uniref:uncharacterized protein LOC108634507 n=1 Tax=Capra hircus TaxID=9925 RepID=UPI000847683D|nr:PREDICTED: uncharacterized protein LOC108634507 [Capra hircus]
MEILDEFDREFPQTVTFCQLISEEDFERQAAACTERALRRLFRSLDRNPALAERVVRKGKQAECERRGLLSFLWVRPAGRGRGRGVGGGRGRRRGGFPEAAAQASGFLRAALPAALAGQGVACGPGGAELL